MGEHELGSIVKNLAQTLRLDGKRISNHDEGNQFNEESSRKLPRTNKNLIIETRNEKIYTQKLKVELKDRKMAFDSPRLKAVSGSASLIAGSNLFQISELKLIDDQ